MIAEEDGRAGGEDPAPLSCDFGAPLAHGLSMMAGAAGVEACAAAGGAVLEPQAVRNVRTMARQKEVRFTMRNPR